MLITHIPHLARGGKLEAPMVLIHSQNSEYKERLVYKQTLRDGASNEKQ